MFELLTALEWDQGTRGVGMWNDPLEFLERFLDALFRELVVRAGTIWFFKFDLEVNLFFFYFLSISG